VSETEEEKDEEIPDEISCLLGILVVQTANANTKWIVQKGHSLTKTGTRCYYLSCMGIIFQVHTSTGATPLLPSVYNMEVVPPPMEFDVLTMKSSPGQLYQKDEASFQQEGMSP